MSSPAVTKLAQDPKAKAAAQDRRGRMTVDHGPTAAGHHWYCNGCPFTCASFDDALAHAIDARDNHAFPHMLYEKATEKDRPRRRIATYIDGFVQAETTARPKRAAAHPLDEPAEDAPAAKPAAKKKPAKRAAKKKAAKDG